MKQALVISVLAGLLATAGAAVQTQDAAGKAKARTASVVFVQTNEPGGNRIVVFDRAANGRLSRAGAYATGGNGGVAAPGTESDHLGSQGSLVYDAAHPLLPGVKPGRGSVSTFSGAGDQLHPREGGSPGGQFPPAPGGA